MNKHITRIAPPSSRPIWLTRFLAQVIAALMALSFLHLAGAATAVPRIDLFQVDPTEDIAPGTELSLRVEGTPKGTASVRIQGIAKTLSLPEVDEGVYETSYTLRSKDKVVNGASVRATLKVGTRSVTNTLTGGLATAKAAVVVPAAPAGVAITRFGVGALSKIEPGADLVFSLDGTAGGSGGVKVVGLSSEVPLREVSAGHYEAAYTVRRADKIAADAKATARLVVAGKTATATLAQALVIGGTAVEEVATATATALPLKITSHQDNTLVATGPATLRGSTAPGADIDVEVTAHANVGGFFGVNQNLLKQRVTADAKGDFSFVFRPPVTVRGATYDINLSGYKGAQKATLKMTLTQEK